ncbi:hypothetical protein [Pseudochelatococcus sp. G4_1912]|uniref:hypothetical protein n=1 Tax=Pseudochelatococcus sp. G4_1912 TaxID=3114288 RepID=UPI0039C5DB76
MASVMVMPQTFHLQRNLVHVAPPPPPVPQKVCWIVDAFHHLKRLWDTLQLTVRSCFSLVDAAELNSFSEDRLRSLNSFVLNMLPGEEISKLNAQVLGVCFRDKLINKAHFINNISHDTLKDNISYGRRGVDDGKTISVWDCNQMLKDLPDAEVKKLDGHFLNCFSDIPYSRLDVELLNKLSIEALGKINLNVLYCADNRRDDYGEYIYGRLQARVLNNLSPETLKVLNAWIINYLSREALEELDVSVFYDLSDDALKGLNASVLNGLSDNAIGAFDASVLGCLSVDALKNLNPSVSEKLSNDAREMIMVRTGLNTLSAEDLTKLDASDLNKLSQEALKWLDASVLNSLSVEVLGELNASVLNGLSQEALKWLDASVLNGLSVKVLGELSASVVSGLSGGAFQLLNLSVFLGLSTKEMGYVTDEAAIYIIHKLEHASASDSNENVGFQSDIGKLMMSIRCSRIDQGRFYADAEKAHPGISGFITMCTG